jgi:metallo-beta-lactamase family protein
MGKAVLTFLGAAGGVTGSCYHLDVFGAGLLVDCGVFQGEREADARNRDRFPFDPKDLAGAVLTHGHLDHVGRLPLLAGALDAPVVGHGATLDIAKVILEDSAKVAIHASRDPLYGRDEVAEVVARARPVGYGAPITLGPYRLTFFDAGHILGSSSVRVAWHDGQRERAILFSGDLGRWDTPILRDPHTAWDQGRDHVDWVVTESTYGDRQHPDRDTTRTRFRDIVERAVGDGGKVLIPAFSIGRTQEILFELNALVEAGRLRNVPVVVDGPLGLSATRIYERHRECYDAESLAMLKRGDAPLEFDHLFSAAAPRDSARAVDIEGPAIIIAGSGMLQGGRIRRHLRAHLDDPRTDLLLVGYQGRGTLGRELQDGARSVWIDGEDVAVRARVTTLSGFSAHADADELLTWMKAVPIDRGGAAFVTHGEDDAALAHARRLHGQLGLAARVPALGDRVTLT